MPSLLPELLHLPEGFRILELLPSEQQIIVTIASTAALASCPQCTSMSTRLHSNYTRRLADVPCGGRTIVLHVATHKWRCQNQACPQKVFAERLTPLAHVQARMTQRCVVSLQHLGLFVTGEGGVRLGQHLGIVTSPTTLLRRVMDLPDPEVLPPYEIGIDDWSYRRGRRYGTIIVDHRRRRVIDLLADRETATVATWLHSHPSVHLISRDRSREFATASQQGAPQATQVLDRWHLLKNLTDLLPSMLAPCVRQLRHHHPPVLPEMAHYPEPAHWFPTPAPQREAKRRAHQDDRVAHYERVLAMKHEGIPTKYIAQQMAMPVRTINAWLTTFRRDTRRRKRASLFDPFAPYVLERWQQGCRNASQLWRELVTQGFSGSSWVVTHFVKTLREQDHQAFAALPPPAATSPVHRYTLTQLVWLLMRSPSELRETEQDDIDWLCCHDATVAHVYQVVQAFRRLLHERHEGQLEQWATLCEAHTIPALQRFVQHLRQEWPQVVNAATLVASNGPTEGFVNKLKLIKRQTYGRAGFALLRKRVLHAA